LKIISAVAEDAGSSTSSLGVFLLGLVLSVYIGFQGNDWRRLKLIKKGYVLTKTVYAENPDNAIATSEVVESPSGNISPHSETHLSGNSILSAIFTNKKIAIFLILIGICLPIVMLFNAEGYVVGVGIVYNIQNMYIPFLGVSISYKCIATISVIIFFVGIGNLMYSWKNQ
jgi:hypothetical protein